MKEKGSARLPAIVLRIMVFVLALAGCAPENIVPDSGPIERTRQSAQDWPFGPYQVVENWPRPLPDDRHSHDGWTWGSMGGVYAESPDRIWIAMRGELPLPEDADPWTPYAALDPSRGISNSNTDGITATCRRPRTCGDGNAVSST